MEGLLPNICGCSAYFTFQQDGSPAHRARETVELLIEASDARIHSALSAQQSGSEARRLRDVVDTSRACVQEALPDHGRGRTASSK